MEHNLENKLFKVCDYNKKNNNIVQAKYYLFFQSAADSSGYSRAYLSLCCERKRATQQ